MAWVPSQLPYKETYRWVVASKEPVPTSASLLYQYY